jgi:hypothetical protein
MGDSTAPRISYLRSGMGTLIALTSNDQPAGKCFATQIRAPAADDSSTATIMIMTKEPVTLPEAARDWTRR